MLKKIIISTIILLLIGAAGYWYIYTEKFTNTSEQKPDYIVNATDFIREFEKNDSFANKKYAEKIITVNGIVSEVEPADTTINLKISGNTNGSYIIFAFQSDNMLSVKKIKAGDRVSIKGSCSGGAYSEILETEFITFKRCIINK